jgi:MoxR-like ATPase
LIEVMRRTTAQQDLHASRVLTPDELLEMRRLSREVILAPHLEEMAADIVMKTHSQAEGAPESARRYVRFGASPRGAQAIIVTAKALALLSGRYNVSASDIEAVARPSLRHRIILNFEGEADSISTDSIIDDVLDGVAAHKKS